MAEAGAPARRNRSWLWRLMLLPRALRVYQWTKNLLVYAALFFAHDLFEPRLLLVSTAAFVAFCCAASATYLLNDIIDIEQDRQHPKKRYRPLASGELSIRTGWMLLLALFALGLAIGWRIGPVFLLALGSYVVLTIAYSLRLKHVLILDVIVVALGFVIRALAGAIAIEVVFTNWLVVCTLFLALFLALSKRRQEAALLQDEAGNHREVLGSYTVPLLDQWILIVAGGTLLTYTIYTCSPDVIARLGTDKLYVTIPFVVYGLFRYLFLLHQRDVGGDPSATLLQDPPLAATVIAWAATCGVLIYA